MKRLLAALVIATAASSGPLPALAQEAPEESALQNILEGEVPEERMQLAMQLVRLTGTSRSFDELLPNIADQAKNAFIRANPQMQLGIIEVVDRIALTLVSRRPELDDYLARVWASGFTDGEMQELINFYSSDVGKKYADLLPELLAVQMGAAQEWGRSVGQELTQRVSEELRATMAAEESVLTGGEAPPAPATPEPAPAP
jgi:hypothetical protein